MRFPAKITWSCIWVVIPVDRVILHWYACVADEPPANYHVFSGFSGMGIRSRALRLNNALETRNTRKNSSRRILTGILSKNSENSQLEPKFKL